MHFLQLLLLLDSVREKGLNHDYELNIFSCLDYVAYSLCKIIRLIINHDLWKKSQHITFSDNK